MRPLVNVPFLSLRFQDEQDEQEILQRHKHIREQRQYILGKETELFEENYASLHLLKFCAGVGNGHDALQLALCAAGIGKGDEIIVPSNTCVPTISAVCQSGARPVFCDPDPDFYTLSAEAVAKKISRHTKALLPVNLYGACADLPGLRSLADKEQLFLLEDNAQAQGAEIQGRISGAWGDASATSFYPTKNLGAWGDAGAILTNSESIDKAVRLMRNYGAESRVHYPIKGINSRLDEIQAAVLNVRLKKLDERNSERIRTAKMYKKLLEPLEEKSFIKLPASRPYSRHVFHVFAVRILSKERKSLVSFLKKNGIQTAVHYPVPPHFQPAFQDLGYRKGDFPISESLSEKLLSLPLFTGITNKQVEYVCEKFFEFFMLKP